MKKSLFAIAAVTAFAGAAQAQSSVTVYGLLDVGFAGTTSRTTTAASAPSAVTVGNQGVLRTNTTGFSGAGSQSTSRLGIRGTEDLGGGTAVFFTAEFALNPTDTNLSGSTNGGLFNRQSFVGLSQKGIGQAAIGTQYTPIHLAVAATDPGAQNNMIGSIIYTTSAAQGSGQTSTSYTVRQNQAITFATENISGFRATAMYVNNNRDATQYGQGQGVIATYPTSLGFGGTTNSSGYGVGANYTLQKFYIAAAYQSFKNESDNANATSAYPATTAFGSALPSINSRIVAGASTSGNGIGTDAANGFNITDNQMYVAATYDFGILKAYANYINRKATSTNNSNAYASRTGQQIGVTGNITKTINAFATVGNGAFRAYGSTSPTVNFTAYQLGTNYVMSKRTNLYAIYGATQVSSASGVAVSSTNASAGASSYAVGIRHTF